MKHTEDSAKKDLKDLKNEYESQKKKIENMGIERKDLKERLQKLKIEYEKDKENWKRLSENAKEEYRQDIEEYSKGYELKIRELQNEINGLRENSRENDHQIRELRYGNWKSTCQGISG